MMVKRKLDGAMDESSVDQDIHKSNAIVHNLWKIWRSAPCGTGSYSRQAGKWNFGEAWDFNPLSRISHLSGSHASQTHAIDYNAIAKEIIRLA